MGESVANGFPCWVDLSTVDVSAASEFYSRLFGWTVSTNDTPMGDYAVGALGDREVAGMMEHATETAGTPSMWMTYFYVADLDGTNDTIMSAGGRVLTQPFEIPGGGRVSVATDPGGAMFALTSGRPQPAPYLSMTPGAVTWVELMTRRPDSALDFYREVFAWATAAENANGTDYTVFRLDDTQVAGMVPAPHDLPVDVPDGWSVYFATPDCAATIEQATALGGSVVLAPTETPMGPFAVLADPQRAVFQIMEYTVEPDG